MLDHYGRPVPLDTLRQQSGLCQDGTSAVDLLRLARRHGLEAKAYSRNPDGLAALGFPLIVQTDFNHMMVVEGITPESVRVNDPASGPADLPQAIFSERFTGIVLVLRPQAAPMAQPGPIGRIQRRLRRDWAPVWHALPPAVRRRVTASAVAAAALTLLPAGLIAATAVPQPPPPPLWTLGLSLLCLCVRTVLLTRTAPLVTAALRTAAITTLCQQPGRYFSMRGSDRLFTQMKALSAPEDTLGGSVGGRLFDLLLIPACLGAALLQGSVTGSVLIAGVFLLTMIPVGGAVRHRTALWRRFPPTAPRLPGLTGRTLTRDTNWAFSGQRASLWAFLTGSAAQTLTDSHRAGLSLLSVTAGCLLAMTGTALLGGAGLLTPAQTGLTLLAQAVLWRLTDSLPDLVSLQRIAPTLADLLSASPVGPPPASVPAHPATPLIVDGLSFGYRPGHPPLIEGLSLTLAAGEQVSLTGQSGTGKSTLLRLISGLDHPWSGTITRPDRIALLDGDSPFPAGSLRDCLTLSGAISAGDDTLEQALRQAEAWDFVAPRGGLSMAVPNGATCFSGGQKRRLALARTLLTRPALLLIDEAFDSLDPALEARIRTTLRQERISLLAVSQRPESLQMADRALILTAEGVTPWSAAPGDIPSSKGPQRPETLPALLPPGTPRPLSAGEEDAVRQILRRFRAGPLSPCPPVAGGDPLRQILHQTGVLTRRVRLRPHDRLDRTPETLLLRSGGHWRLLTTPEQASPRPETDALSLWPLSRSAPSPWPPLWRAGVTGLLLCLPALLAGLLIQASRNGATEPLLLLLAGSIGVVPVARWIRSHSDRCRMRAHSQLWSWLLFLPLSVLRRGHAETLEALLPEQLDGPRFAVPALLILPPLLTLNLTAVFGTPATPLLMVLAAAGLATALWQERRDRALLPRQQRTERTLSAALRALPGLRLLSADDPVLRRWQQEQEQLDRSALLTAHLTHLNDLAPIALLLTIACGLAAESGLPVTGLPPLALLFAAVSAHGGGLSFFLRRRPPLFPEAGQQPPHASPPPAPAGSPLTLTAENLIYTLPGSSKPLIGPAAFSLSLHPGTVTALVGPSGCGKTTLTRLLTGVLTPQAGRLLINGRTVDEESLALLQQRTGWLEQDDSLPVGTVRSHVSGTGTATEADCWQALQAVGMADTIAALPMGLQAVISGQTLPAGHSRLLHLAQVMLTRPALLILDEALSGVETDRLPALLEMIRHSGCACLLITHRPDILPLTDAAWQIRDGQMEPVTVG